jgi:hypothetical protein
MMNRIDSFKDEYEFLSNFYPAQVEFERITFPTLEHAFQFAGTQDAARREQIRQAATPGKAKRLAHKAPLREDWPAAKVGVMRELLKQKFAAAELRQQLIETGDREIIEGNYWQDNFWGVCTCGTCTDGQNTLGRLLMEIRQELGEEPASGFFGMD